MAKLPDSCHEPTVVKEELLADGVSVSAATAEKENRRTEEADEEVPEFSHEQLHEFIDMSTQRFSEQAGMQGDSFGDVASAMRIAFPCPAGCYYGAPAFSRSQVRRLLDITAEKCGQRLEQR